MKDIKNVEPERWKQNIKASCIPGILAKFEQNPHLADLLKSTKDKRLVECCKDRDWGTGIPLHDTNALNPSYWHSQGLLGDMLETVCNILLEPTTTAQPEPMEAVSDQIATQPATTGAGS